MNREQYFNTHRYQDIDRDVLERKWIRFQHEQEMLEQMMLYEAARNAQSAAAVASGAGGGYVNPTTEFYFFGTDNGGDTGVQLNIDSLGNLIEVGAPYNGITVFCKNSDNGITYYIEIDRVEELMVVGILNPVTGERAVLDTSVLDGYYATPSSLFYIGNNQFLYLNNCPIFGPTETNIQNILLLNISNNGNVTIEEELGGWDYTESLVLTSLFKVGAEIWVTVTPTGFPLSGIGKLSFDPVEVLDVDFLGIEGLPFPNYKFWFVTGITNAADGIYINSAVNDKDEDTLRFCIAKIDVENYTSQYVQEIGQSPFTTLDIEAK